MKYYELKQIASYLGKFKKIFAIERVDDSIIKFIFDKSEPIFADLKRGNSDFFIAENFTKAKIYNAPFDVLLHKYFARSEIEKVEVLQNNRILCLHVKANSNYKSTNVSLQLEFTGRNTNAIILDEQKRVLEALRHIDKSVSFRSVKVGEILAPLPPLDFSEKEETIEDIYAFLKNVHVKKEERNLENLKLNKLAIISKKLKKLSHELDKLPLEEDLKQKANKFNEFGGLILANLHVVKPYTKEVELENYSGEKIKIDFPKEAKSPQHGANMLYEKSKKLKQKANSIHIEKENLQNKINFLERLSDMIKDAKTSDEVNIILPKQQNSYKKTKTNLPYESFFVEGYKIMVGKSEKSNIALLKEAKKNDIWLHIKEIPSSHVIVRTNKQNIPENVLEFAAKLCVNFSTSKKGNFLVDFTAFKNVKIQSGANVFYVNYKTIKVLRN